MLSWYINWYSIFAYALGASFAMSWLLTGLVRRLAIRWNILDHPGERKMQRSPVPLLGGVAIWLTFNVMIFAHLAAIIELKGFGIEWVRLNVVSFLGYGAEVVVKLTGLFAGGLLIFILGVVDDLKALRPETKLLGQIVAALVLVLSGIRVDVLNDYPWLAAIATMFWVIMMTNAMNFLDNMDGLCAGVSVIAALAFFACVLHSGQTFVCVLLMVFAGSVAGFLYHNFNPARIFMGDAGAMFCGYILATVSILGTYYIQETTPSRVAVAAPLLALSVPIFDTLSVVFIRWRRGESIMKGDKRHFSHRLMEIGMTPSHAVEFIYLVGAVTGLGAVLLPHVDLPGTIIILLQAVGLYCLIVLLMNSGAKNSHVG